MRPDPIAPLLLVGLAVLLAGAASADTWVDPGGPTEAICDVSHVGEDHSGESAFGFVFDGVPFTASLLSNVDFKNASLACIPDSNGWACDGRCVDFSAATLEGALFQVADATGASFFGVNATGAGFSKATLVDADMLAAELRSTIWDGANATGARLEQVDLSDARGRSDENPTIFTGASLRGAKLLRVDFGASDDLSRTSFAGADLGRTTTDCRYEEIEVPVEGGEEGETTTEIVASDCPDFSFADFEGADLRSASWRGAELGGASFIGATTLLAGAAFDEVDLTSGGLDGAAFDGAVLDDMALRDAIFVDESPSGAGIARASFEGASLAGADLSRAVLCHPFELVDVDEDGDVCDDVAATPTECVDWTGAGVGVTEVLGRSLVQTSLSGAWGPGIDLEDFALHRADLRLADMRCASLGGSDLTDTRVDGADFGGASFVLVPGAPDPDVPADLSGTVAGCLTPQAEGGAAPDPICSRFDGASLEGVSFSSAILDGTSFVGAQLDGAGLDAVSSLCPQLPVDPDTNGGLTERTFCADFTGASLGRDASDVPIALTDALMTGPIFDSADADGIVLAGTETSCIDGRRLDPVSGEPESHRFCASFLNTTLTRAELADSILFQARLGCLDDDGEEAPEWQCTDLRGARLSGARLAASQWVGPVDLGDYTDAGPVVPTDLSDADLSEAVFTCRGFTYTVGGSEEVLAEARCPIFGGTVLTPGFDLSNGGAFGVDWSNQDLTGADLSGTTLGCFVFEYEDELGNTKTLAPLCTDLSGATLTYADLSDLDIDEKISLAGVALGAANLSRADLRGVDLSGADLRAVNLEDALMDADTRFNAGYTPAAGASADEQKDDCVLGDGEVATDVRGAHLGGVDFRDVVDFGGECILYDPTTTYTDETQGLTDTLEGTMTKVPEPGPTISWVAGLLTLALLARRSRPHASR